MISGHASQHDFRVALPVAPARIVLLLALVSLTICLGPAVSQAAAAPKGIVGFISDNASSALPQFTGAPNTFGGQLSNPGGIAVNHASGDVYVADRGNRRIQQFESDGQWVRAWGLNVEGVNEIQRLTIEPLNATTGTYTLSFNGEETVPLAHNATAASIRNALASLPSIGSTENVSVSGDSTSPVKRITFTGALADTDVPEIVVDDSGLAPATGTIETAVEGFGGVDETGFEICEVAVRCKEGSNSPGSRGGTLSSPQGVAVDQTSGHLYVTDSSLLRIQEFTESGQFVRAWGAGVVDGGAAGTGDITNGSKTVSSLVTTSKSFLPGQTITGNGIPAGTIITSAAGSSLTLSKAATESGSGVELTVAPGAGNVDRNERQTVTIGGGPTGGTFTLSWNPGTGSQTTSAIPFNASASEVQEALEGLAALGPGDISVSSSNPGGGPTAGGPYTVEFTGSKGDTDVAQITSNPGGLTPVGGKTVTTATSVAGASAFEICTVASQCKAGVNSTEAGGFGSGFFAYPAVVPPGPSNAGNVIVPDPANRRVQEFTSSGSFVRMWGKDVVASGQPNDVSSETSNFEVCDTGHPVTPNAATDCQQGAVQSPGEPGQFPSSQPSRAAADSTGAVYTVESSGTFRVQRFTAAPAPPANERTLAAEFFAPTELTGTTSSSSPTDVAIGSGENPLVVKAFEGGAGTPPATEFGERRVLELDSSGNLVDTHMGGAGFTNVNGLAVDPGSEDIYVSSTQGGSRIYVLGPTSNPVVTPLELSEVTATGATVSSTVNPMSGTGYPNPPRTSFHFDFKRSTDSEWTPYAAPKDIGTGSSPIEVSDVLGGLDPATEYDVRLIVTKQFGAGSAIQVASFTTGPAPPKIDAFFSSNLTKTSATLNARINPQGSDTTYRFEFGTTANYGQSVPVPDGNIGAGHTPVAVSETIEGLQPVTYHFRVVAENAEGETATEDQTINFFPPACPNATVRQQTGSNYLPDCRAYELVSPEDAGGTTLIAGGPNTGYASNPARMSFLGIFGSIPGEERNINTLADLYFSTRTSGGWKTKYIGLSSWESPCMGNPVNGLIGEGSQGYGMRQDYSYRYVPTDPGMNRVALWNLGPPLQCAKGGAPDLATNTEESNAPYVFNADGEFVDRWPGNLLSVENGYAALDCAPPEPAVAPQCNSTIGVSGDLSHFVFSTQLAQFAPGGISTAPGSVYDYNTDTGEVSVVSLTPENTPIPQEPGTTDPSEFIHIPKVSMDGSHILMSTASGPRCIPTGITGPYCPSPYDSPVHLWMRVDNAVSYDVSHGAQVRYIGATSDLSKVFFTTAEQLSPADLDSSVDIYMWSESDPANLTVVSLGENGTGNTDACTPEPAGSTPWTTQCNVVPISFYSLSLIQGHRGGNGVSDSFIASEAGDIYFYSPEQLDGTNRAAKHQQNLFVYRNGEIRYVTTFRREGKDTGLTCIPDPNGFAADTCSDGPVARMNISPSGDNVAFITADRITSYDNAGFAQMYTFDPDTGEITCVSCLPDGSPPTASVQGAQNGLFMSNDGRVAFFTTAPLVPRDTNKIGDVYEYSEGRAQLITTGTGTNEVEAGVSESGGGLTNIYGQPGLYGVSADGVDIYFSTFDTLVSGDRNGQMLKFYDARSGGGFEQKPPRLPCAAADECHGPESEPPLRARIGTGAGLRDRGNVQPDRCIKHQQALRRAVRRERRLRKSFRGAKIRKAESRRANKRVRQAKRRVRACRRANRRSRTPGGGGK